MTLYKEEYLQKFFDDFDFFEPECRDIRIREVNMRNKRCLSCPGFKACQKHPDYWLDGEEERHEINEAIKSEG